MKELLNARPIVPGTAEGIVINSKETLSFWGGVDPNTGIIIDRRHDLCGETISGRVFVFPSEKGSSTASAVLVELIRNGRAPAAIITVEVSPILALGAIVAAQMYSRTIPILMVSEDDTDELVDGDRASINTDGIIRIKKHQDGDALG